MVDGTDTGTYQLRFVAYDKDGRAFVEAARSLRVARENNDAGDGPVEPVRDAEVDVARLVVVFLQVGFDEPFERGDAGLSRRVRDLLGR